MLDVAELAPSRPPCSATEREAAEVVAAHLRHAGLMTIRSATRGLTSPTWAPLLRALLRVWAAAFLAAGWPNVTIGLAAASMALSVSVVWGSLRRVPLLGAPTTTIAARSPGRDPQARPIVVVAHLDTHPIATDPPSPTQTAAGMITALLAIVVAVGGRGAFGDVWRWVAALLAVEAAITITWLTRRELARVNTPPDDNTSGLLALTRLAELLDTTPHDGDVWLVASGAGTSGGAGITAFLADREELRNAWVIEVDALGNGEVVASPHPSRFPYPGTPQALARAVADAARATGDPMRVRHIRRRHSDAKAALRERVGAITLTGGIPPPVRVEPIDVANAQRAALVLSKLLTGGGDAGS